MAAPPYLAVTLQAKRRMVWTAKSLDLHPGIIVFGWLEVCEFVWETKRNHLPARVVVAAFGPDQRIPGAMVDLGFLLADGDGWKLTQSEADRLLLTHAKRVAAGKARVAGCSRDAGRFAGDALVDAGEPDQHATSTRPARDQHNASADPPRNQVLHPAPSTQHPAPKEEPSTLELKEQSAGEKKPRRRSEGQQFWDHYQQERQRLHGWIPEAEVDPATLNAWFGRALKELEGAETAPLERLWAAGAHFLLEDVYWTAAERKSPFRAFMKDDNWRKHVPRERVRETGTS